MSNYNNGQKKIYPVNVSRLVMMFSSMNFKISSNENRNLVHMIPSPTIWKCKYSLLAVLDINGMQKHWILSYVNHFHCSSHTDFFFFLSLESHSNSSFTRSKCSRQTTMGISYEIHGKYSSKRTRIATIEINLDDAGKFLVEISRHAIKNDRTKISTAMCQRIRKTSSQSTTIRSNNEE